MGFFDFLKQPKNNQEQVILTSQEKLIPDEEYRKNEVYYELRQCPNCQFQFDKPVTRTKACPECQNPIHYRTNFETDEKILLTDEELSKFEIECILKKHKLLNKFREVKRYKPDSKDYVVAVELLQGLAKNQSDQNNWGLFSIVLYDISKVYRWAGLLKESLYSLLEVCYYDLNGGINVGSADTRLLRDFSPFQPKSGLIPPRIALTVDELMDELELSLKDVESMFISHNGKIKNPLIPLSPEKAWKKLKKELVK